MIELSTAAKMKLAENRTTLFKADLILNDYPSAVGANLDMHEDGQEEDFSINAKTTSVYYIGTAQGFDVSQIPQSLMEKYQYIIFSMYLDVESLSNSAQLKMGYIGQKDGVMWAWRMDEDNAANLELGSKRYFGVFETEDVISLTFDASATLFTAFRVSENVTLESTIGMVMCELNNTGIPSDYVDSYVENGGLYTDFLTPSKISLTGDDVMSGTATFSDSTSSSGSFDIGAAIINSMSLTLNNYDDRFAGIDFTGASVRAYIGVPIEPVEWITKGYYTVDKPTSIGNTIPLTMLDNMSKFEKPYKNVTQLYPATLYDIVHSICTYCGVVLNDTSFPNSDFVIPVRPDDTNMTCLAMISYVAQIAGCYARVNRFGYLEFKWYSIDVFESEGESYDGGTFSYTDGDALDGGTFAYDDGDSADGGTFDYGEYYSCYALSTFSVGTEDIVVSGIRVVVDSDNEVAVGADGYVLEISDNPLVTADNMATVANYLGNQLVGMKFRPFNISALSEPSVEAGDAIRITDSKGNYYDSFITTCFYKFGNYEPFACNAQTVSENGATSYSPITKAVEKARKESEKALSSYDLGVIRMNEIAMNAMGYHSSYTENLDGSRISFIHNKPTREESTIIWQQSASGFFLSTDGGVTWASGWDANGNAVLNILYAIGIVCDWIKGGTLTLGGSNNVNGLLRVLSASGTEVCRIDQNSLKAINADISGKATINDGSIGGFSIGANYIGNATLGQSLNGMKLETNGSFGFSKVRGSSWAEFNGDLQNGVIQLWTAGSTHGGGGLDVSGAAPGGSSGWCRWGWSDGQRSDGYYVSWYSGSDKRLKKNVKTLENGFLRELFSRINPIEFNYKKASCADTSEKHFGVIAQEIQELLEDLGYGNNHIVEEKAVLRKSESGKDSYENYYYVNYHELHGLEIGAIKDLYEIVDKQQKQIAEQAELIQKLIEKVGGI